MAQFDDTLADLQAKLTAMNAVLTAHPEVAAKVAAAVDGATVDPATVKTSDDQAQDDARANALARTIETARKALDPEHHPVRDGSL